MKKNIFLIVGITTTVFFVNRSVNGFELDIEVQEEQAMRSFEEAEDFEGFFFSEAEEETVQPRQKKQKPSPLQLAMIRLGVAVALRVENFYNNFLLLYAYLKSWVVHEKRKA